MQLKRFGLGIRFDFLSPASQQEHARRAFEEIFSVLTLSELEGLLIYGGQDPMTDPVENVFLAVIMGGSLKTMRRIYKKISADAAICMYLAPTHPFIENNRLYHWEGACFYGEVHKDGTLQGGDGTLSGLTVPEKHGRRKPVGKGIKVLFAPDGYGELSSEEAIKRLSAAARRHFQGVKIVPVPVTYGGPGMVRALAAPCEGALRTAKITRLGEGGKDSAEYGVLHGKVAVMELAQVLPEGAAHTSSLNAGELVRRALDEGVRQIVMGTQESVVRDYGMGCMRALGIKFFDAAGAELKGAAEELARVAAVDTEYLHARLKEVEITILPGGESRLPAEYEADAARFRALVAQAVGVKAEDCRDLGALMCALSGAKRVQGVDALLDAVDFDRLLKGVALMITGEQHLSGASFGADRALPAILARAAERGVPAVVLAGSVDAALDEERLGSAGMMTFANARSSQERTPMQTEALFDEAADRMFRLIRLGRDVEKIGAPKPPKPRDYETLYRESLKKAD